MTCPDCGEEMEREDLSGVEAPGSKATWGAQYFCPRDCGCWFWNGSAGLMRIGTNTSNGPSDVLERYHQMETDDNGQVW